MKINTFPLISLDNRGSAVYRYMCVHFNASKHTYMRVRMHTNIHTCVYVCIQMYIPLNI